MEVIFKKAFRFNLDNLTVNEMNIPVPTQQDIDSQVYTFDAYLNELIQDVLDDDRSKKFLFPEENSAIKTDIAQIFVEETRGTAVTGVATRLLREERAAEAKVEHLDIEIQKGIVVQALVNYGTWTYYVIVKAEHQDFMNETENRKSTGLPIKKKIFKSFCAKLDADGLPLDAMVGDTTARISTYWWDNFLKLIPEKTDEYNTQTAFEAFEKRVFNTRMKDSHPEDWMALRNSTIAHFRSHEEFVMSDYITQISNYVPADPGLNVLALVERIRELPERENFEPRFGIIREKVRKKMVKSLNLNPQLKLVILDVVTPNTVNGIMVNGVKYVRIRSDIGYDTFPKIEE